VDTFGVFLFGVVFAVATYLTYKLLEYGKKYTEKTIINYLMENPDAQEKIKNLFGWK